MLTEKLANDIALAAQQKLQVKTAGLSNRQIAALLGGLGIAGLGTAGIAQAAGAYGVNPGLASDPRVEMMRNGMYPPITATQDNSPSSLGSEIAPPIKYNPNASYEVPSNVVLPPIGDTDREPKGFDPAFLV